MVTAPTPPIAATQLSGVPSSIVFPSDLLQAGGQPYYIAFDFYQWQRRTINDRIFYAAKGQVVLPIPATMIDNNQVLWEGSAMGPIVGAAIEMLGAARAKNTAPSFQDALTAAGKLVETGVVSAVDTTLGPLSQGALNVLGVQINPFLTLFFKSPSFKKHTFEWRLSPTTPDESKTVQQLCATLRYNQLPALAGTALATQLLSYPNIIQPTFYPQDQFLYKFKPCVIESVSIDYAPNVPAFFGQTKAPAEVKLVLNLIEAEYWVQQDVASTWNTSSTPGSNLAVDTTPVPTYISNLFAAQNATQNPNQPTR